MAAGSVELPPPGASMLAASSQVPSLCSTVGAASGQLPSPGGLGVAGMRLRSGNSDAVWSAWVARRCRASGGDSRPLAPWGPSLWVSAS